MSVDTDTQPGLWRRIVAGRNIRTTVRRAILLALFCLLLFNYVLLPVRVRGVSMEPTFRDGSWHLAGLLRFVGRSPRRGEVVVISITGGRRALYLKRVLGLPGETIRFSNGQLMVNGREQEEPYLADKGNWNLAETRLAEDEFFVAGDNRSVPEETHMMGTVKRDRISGGIFH